MNATSIAIAARIAEAIMSSALPREQKLNLFLHAAASQHLELRRAAFSELKELDEGLFIKLLIKTLDALPSTPDGTYWNCPEASFTYLVTETNDPNAWAALARATRRADVGLRMEMLQQMAYVPVGDKHRRNRVEFLADFLNDVAVRDETSDPRRLTGAYAGFSISHLAVRNLAAIEIASILKLNANPWPDGELPSDQWSALREQARKAADGELKGSSPSKDLLN